MKKGGVKTLEENFGEGFLRYSFSLKGKLGKYSTSIYKKFSILCFFFFFRVNYDNIYK